MKYFQNQDGVKASDILTEHKMEATFTENPKSVLKNLLFSSLLCSALPLFPFKLVSDHLFFLFGSF